MVKIAPSILSADFARMGEQVAEAVDGGADYIHIDVMDGRFVPPITFGAHMVEAIKRHAGRVPLDVHLMIHEPSRLVPELVDAGADIEVKARNGMTPLKLARYRGRTEVVKILEAAVGQK